MATEFNQVIPSYHRARETGGLFDSFYELFLAKSPDIPPMFARTDFPHQKLMLRESILEMLLYARDGSSRSVIERLGERHRALKIQRKHYDLWLDALCEALAKHDHQFDANLDHLWRTAMTKGIEIMSCGMADSRDSE